VNSTSHSVNSVSHPINVDDDEIADADPPPRWIGSPKAAPFIQKGKVKQTTLLFESKTPNSTFTFAPTSTPTRPEPNLENFLVPKSTQASGTSTSAAGRKLTRSTPNGPILSGGSTSKGIPIAVGVTRPKAPEGKISARMQGKSQATQGKSQTMQGKSQTSGLKILKQDGLPPPSQKPSTRLKARDKPQDLTLHIQEWYCDPKHYESNASQGSYSFNFDGNMIKIIFSERPGIETRNLCLMRNEVDGFEVVDTAGNESYLWMMVSLNEGTVSKLHWQRDGLGDSNRVLLHFLESDDPDIHERWKA
ncbi:hypothetical protein RSAG8_06988, partial [Rhizoctonia solani AG-8 WAC10335]